MQQHAVEVRPTDAAQQAVRVQAGQQLRFSTAHLGSPQPGAPHADAWTRDMLIVSDWRLADFIGELQRYRPGHLGCADAVANLRISGAFLLSNGDSVLEHLAAALPVRIRQFTRYWVNIEAI